MSEHVNLQPKKSSKIFGVIKTGANNTDKVLIRDLAAQGYNEHEIQQRSGVHFKVIRSFMAQQLPEFKATEAPPTADTQHLHDRIAELEAKNSRADEPKKTLEKPPVLKTKVKNAPKPKGKTPKPQAAAAVTANDY